jgi:glycogen operon protein
MVSALATRLCGSDDLYATRGPLHSINFITCHDGFTLNDLVSYNQKHNEPNGEDNRDGTNDNRSWNCGIEGPTNDSIVELLRNRQAKNFLAVTVLSLGMPMLLMGDEVRRTQGGNNNPYCQDNETSWFDWTLVDKHADLNRFVKLLLSRRVLRRFDGEQQRVSLNQLLRHARKAWHGTKLNQPDWSNQSHSLAVSASVWSEKLCFHLILNAYWEPLEFELPDETAAHGNPWRRWIDTSLASPDDIIDWPTAPIISDHIYRAGPRSVVVLIATDPLGFDANQEGKGLAEVSALSKAQFTLREEGQ